MGASRDEELRQAWRELEARVAQAASDYGRDIADLTVIAVTKTFSPSDIKRLFALGARDIGENRADELAKKAQELSEIPTRWHMVGQLQTNKARQVAQWADVIHSCDRPRLVTALDRAAGNHARRLQAFVQVSLDGDSRRGGVASTEVLALADAIAATTNIELVGVMALAPQDMEPARAFSTLQEISTTLKEQHPQARWISAGMSADLEYAVAHGATHLRVGRSLLGTRPLLG